MSLGPFLISYFLLRYLRNSWVPRLASFSWKQPLKVFLIAGTILLFVEVIFDLEAITKWIWYFTMISITALMYKTDDLKHSRNVLLGVMPFIVISLFSDTLLLVNKNLFSSWKPVIDTALVFSVLWLVTIWVINHKQQKTLEKERRQRALEEEQSRIMAARKEELEIMVSQRTAELTTQKEGLQKALADLSSMQQQLIQQEKLASLGELTAGIAHEIQNPLNFVNNFAEVSSELIEELQVEQQKHNGNLVNEGEILETLKENLAKIRHHGRRADSIVKGMLLHSRRSSGKMEAVDINSLTDEYLRLSFHGFRAKDKTFNASLETDFDNSIGEVKVLPQELGRVILNLLTNAFYSVNQKRNCQEDFHPTIWVQTKKLKDRILICVKDNGVGIPPKVLDKIFQPFFSTKPSGEGTGLGLSLSYDIITKTHRGEMKAESKEGEFAEFKIFIPINLS
jgi:two-component system NtrC family sensor kinase